MDVLPSSKAWSEEGLAALPDDAGKCELVDGELVMGPGCYQHAFLIFAPRERLRRFVRVRKLGMVGGSNLGCWMSNGNLRCPVMP